MCVLGVFWLTDFSLQYGSYVLSPLLAWCFLIRCQTLWNLYCWVLDIFFYFYKHSWTLFWVVPKLLRNSLILLLLLLRFVRWIGAVLILGIIIPHYWEQTHWLLYPVPCESVSFPVWLMGTISNTMRVLPLLNAFGRFFPCIGLLCHIHEMSNTQFSTRGDPLQMSLSEKLSLFWDLVLRTGPPCSPQSLTPISITHGWRQAPPEFPLPALWPGDSQGRKQGLLESSSCLLLIFRGCLLFTGWYNDLTDHSYIHFYPFCLVLFGFLLSQVGGKFGCHYSVLDGLAWFETLVPLFLLKNMTQPRMKSNHPLLIVSFLLLLFGFLQENDCNLLEQSDSSE